MFLNQNIFKYSIFSDYSIQNILNNELFLNHHTFFNDPFECNCKISFGYPEIDFNCSRFRKIINTWGYNDIEDQWVLENYQDLKEIVPEADIKGTIDQARISCFSKRSDNLLMWSHYGNGLRGFCLEFDPTFVNNNPNAQLLEVLYEKSPPHIDATELGILYAQIDNLEDTKIGLTNIINRSSYDEKIGWEEELKKFSGYLDNKIAKHIEIYQKMLATKSIEWSYEEELRIIVDTENQMKTGEFMVYPSDSLKSIIIGEKMPERQIRSIKNFVQSRPHEIRLKVASLIEGKFEVEIRDFTDSFR